MAQFLDHLVLKAQTVQLVQEARPVLPVAEVNQVSPVLALVEQLASPESMQVGQ
jgi:hypothetical protein